MKKPLTLSLDETWIQLLRMVAARRNMTLSELITDAVEQAYLDDMDDVRRYTAPRLAPKPLS